MDCKGYYGSAYSQSFYKKHAKQIQKYNAEFGGIGAVVFKLGYSEDLVRYIHYSPSLTRNYYYYYYYYTS